MNGVLVKQDEEVSAPTPVPTLVRHCGGDKLLIHLTYHAQPLEHGSLEADCPAAQAALVGCRGDGSRDIGHVLEVGILPGAHQGHHLAPLNRCSDGGALLLRLPLRMRRLLDRTSRRRHHLRKEELIN